MSTPLDIQVTVVTPALAEKWLEGNINNRNVRRRIVQQYAADMVRGSWRLNGDSLRFNGDGTLLDGQHRLLACVEARVAFTTLVIRGLATDDRVTFDAGVKRKFSDVLGLLKERNANELAAAVRACWVYENSPNPAKAAFDAAPSHQGLLAWLQANPDARQAVAVAQSVRRQVPAPATSVAVTYLYGFRLDAEDATDFFERLRTGTGLHEGSPILALRRYLELLRPQRAKPKTEVITAHVIKAFNYYRDGREIDLLMWRAGGRTPEPYPRVEERSHSRLAEVIADKIRPDGR